jgi:subtilisin family serine protease
LFCLLCSILVLSLPVAGLVNPAGLAAGPPAAEEEAPRSTTAASRSRERQLQEHLARLGVNRWHAAAYRGQGVKIAVLDTGFHGYRAYLGQALPARVTVHSFRKDGNLEARDSQHGILCAEVIHALAPDAELLFADWDVGQLDQFLAAVRWARAEGARIITCSVITPSWSDGEGGGAVHQELTRILGPGNRSGGMLCFASAGNTIDRHWSGRFRDGCTGIHEWRPGHTDNPLTPWPGERVAVELYARPGTDYELAVHDAATGQAVERATTGPSRGGLCSAAIRFWPQGSRSYDVRVRRVRGPIGTFHLTTTFASLTYTTGASSVCFPADGAEVIAMGAVDDSGHRQSYSACGPNSPRPKPDLTAIVPFPTRIRERLFGGTSAASPQGAALAALWWSRHPDWTADQVREALRTAAQDLGPPGPDCETGYGLVHLPPD